MDVETLIMGIYGDIKTGKTSLALTAPKPLVHFDLDQGFERAEPRVAKFRIKRIPPNGPNLTEDLFQNYDIVTKPYQIPLRFSGQKVHGMIGLWEMFLEDYRIACTSPHVKSLVVDTGTVLWAVRTQAHLEKIQKERPERTNLIQIEYAVPNADMRAVYGAARTYGKNLIITHHLGGVYEQKLTPQGVQEIRVGDTWAGFSGMGAIVDMVARTTLQRNPLAVVLKVETCGYTLALEGQTFTNPDFTTLLEAINNLRRSGL